MERILPRGLDGPMLPIRATDWTVWLRFALEASQYVDYLEDQDDGTTFDIGRAEGCRELLNLLTDLP